MDLHHVHGTADWERIPVEQHNVWQRLASRTNGILTPANFITAAGTLMVGSGLNDIAHGRKGKGLLKMGIGRLADIADGAVAHKTGTKSPLGEFLDASLDKLNMAAAVPVLMFKEVVPADVGITIGLQNLANAAFSAHALRSGNRLKASEQGKLSTSAQWGVLTAYGASSLAGEHGRDRLAVLAEVPAKSAFIVAAALGVAATIDYAEQAFRQVIDQPMPLFAE